MTVSLLLLLVGAPSQEGGPSFPVLPTGRPVERCEDCHTAAARDVAGSRHADLPDRCTGCHGGDPASSDERRAHSGKFRAVPLAACGICHEAEAEEFSKGPHGVAFETKSIRGCVECHFFHPVEHPGHALLRTACKTCHAERAPDLVELGGALASELEGLDAAFEAAARALDRAAGSGRIVRGERERLESARLARRQLLPKQHGMDLDPFRTARASILASVEAVASDGERLQAEARGRRRWLWLVAGLVALNALALYSMKRSLPPVPNRR